MAVLSEETTVVVRLSSRESTVDAEVKNDINMEIHYDLNFVQVPTAALKNC